MVTDQLHSGHRERLKTKFIEFGGDALSDHELLELLLFFSIPRSNTNEIAHMLINDSGSFEEVFSSCFDQLKLTEGIGDSSALLLSLTGEICKRLSNQQAKPRKNYPTLSSVGKLLVDKYAHDREESISVLYFDKKMNLISMRKVTQGGCHEAAASRTKIVREAMLKKSAGILLAHNHPDGTPTPSPSDLNFTHVLESSLYAVGIILLEHVLICQDSYTPLLSLRPGEKRVIKSNDFAEGVLERFFLQ